MGPLAGNGSWNEARALIGVEHAENKPGHLLAT
jgi:hypothetical protein